MMHWLKQNGALALGVGMPVLLIVFFMLAAWLPKMFVDPPKHDLLFITNYNEYGTNTLRADVRDKQLTFRFIGENFGHGWPKLYRYSASTGGVQEIPIEIPPDLTPIKPYNRPYVAPEHEKVTPVAVPAVEGLKIDNSSVAPDGYAFSSGYDNSSHMMGLFFYSSRYRHTATLSKNGHQVRIPNPEGNYYHANAKFLGWIVP